MDVWRHCLWSDVTSPSWCTDQVATVLAARYMLRHDEVVVLDAERESVRRLVQMYCSPADQESVQSRLTGPR